MVNISEVTDLLKETAVNPANFAANIPKFQQIIWNSEITFPNDAIENVLRNLAHDLDYYEADPKIRSEDISFFGEQKALDGIRTALAAIDLEVK